MPEEHDSRTICQEEPKDDQDHISVLQKIENAITHHTGKREEAERNNKPGDIRKHREHLDRLRSRKATLNSTTWYNNWARNKNKANEKKPRNQNFMDDEFSDDDAAGASTAAR